ncbi:MAG TPA: ferritin-like domain-containing protein [Candidatus Acidoferrales bacterium]|nr:ferritin-like domain-containing protein [Candidatus Acidoferrales bacterium]
MSAMESFWSRMRRALRHDRREDVLILLRREYLTQIKDATQFRSHAEQMRYPQFRRQLNQIAEAEEQHAEALRKRISALGGEIPRISPLPEDGWNNWEELRLDLDDERQRFWDLEAQLPMVEQVDSDTARVLRRILEDEKKHQEAIIGMLMRSDPQAAALA